MKTFSLSEFNLLDRQEVRKSLVHCCGSSSWVSQMEEQRPFASIMEMHKQALQIWRKLNVTDLKEAFEHHPKIGDLKSLQEKFSSTKAWAEQEQKGSEGASSTVLQALALGNKNYENRFGYIFIVCATGKSAEEMLSLLKQRLSHDPEVEIQIAAQEQEKIMILRLEKLIHE